MSGQEEQDRALAEARLREAEARDNLRTIRTQAQGGDDSPDLLSRVRRAEIRLTMTEAFRLWIETTTPTERRAFTAGREEAVRALMAETEALGLYDTEGDETMTGMGLELSYAASFTHEPTDEDRDTYAPAGHRSWEQDEDVLGPAAAPEYDDE